MPRATRRRRPPVRALTATLILAALALFLPAAVPAALGRDQRAPQRAHSRHARHHHRRHHTTGHPPVPPQVPPAGEPAAATPPGPGGTPTGTTAEAPVGEATGSAPAQAQLAFTFPAVGIAAWDELQQKSLAEVERQFTDYGNLHAHWVRADFAWDVIQPAKTTFRWTGFDQWVGVARAKGLNVIATVDYTPAWANGGHSDHSYAPSSPTAFGAFAGQVAARYAPRGVHVYEIWNEPNIVQYWKPKPNPVTYTETLDAAYTAIRQADPSAVILTGGSSPAGTGSTSYSPQDWLRALYAAGAKFDGVSDHPYVDDNGFNWKVMSEYSGSTLRGIMQAHGDAAKKLWATEVGCSWQKVASGESAGRAICAERLGQAFAKWHGYSWGAALCWFTYWDPNVYGLVDEHWTPRPAWYAFQTAAAQYH